MAEVWGFNDRETAERLKEIAAVPQTINKVVTERRKRPGPIGGGDAILGVTRTGGIAARSTTAVPHTFPSATIDLLNPDTGDFYDPNREQIVFNSTSVAISGLHIVQAKRMKDSERYFVDVDDCAVGSDGPVIEEEVVP